MSVAVEIPAVLWHRSQLISHDTGVTAMVSATTVPFCVTVTLASGYGFSFPLSSIGVTGMPIADQSFFPVGDIVPVRPLPASPTLSGGLTPRRAGAYCQKFVLSAECVLPCTAYSIVTPLVRIRGSPPRAMTCACNVLYGGRIINSEKS